jgi:hypothetical protein
LIPRPIKAKRLCLEACFDTYEKIVKSRKYLNRRKNFFTLFLNVKSGKSDKNIPPGYKPKFQAY